MTQNTSLFGRLRRTCFLLTICDFALDCPRLENLMKTFREERMLHFPFMTPILTLTYSPQRNTDYSKLINGLGLVLVAYILCLYLFWVNVLWEKRSILFTGDSVGICFHFRVFASLSENLWCWKPFIAWAEGDWSARTHQNLKVGHPLIYLFIQYIYISCPFYANHCYRQTIKGRSLVKRTLCIDDWSPVSGIVILLGCPPR